MAGPGTGKSFALKRRVGRLLEDGQNPNRVLVVTFTRTAAASLVEDFKGLGVPGCERVEVSTLHSFCFRLLLEQDVFKYLRRVPRPLIAFEKSKVLQFEARPLIADLIHADKALGAFRACTKRIKAFEAAWARLQTDDPGWATDPLDQSMDTHLSSWLEFHHCMLIGELIPEALRYLANNPASDVLSAYDHVIVDEYQDLNRAEQEIIDLLGKDGCISIVGDVDQSIYSFRHANPDGIIDFCNRHPETIDKALDECRRCPKRVVRMADHLISKNYLPPGNSRLHGRGENSEGDVTIVQWRNPQEEIEGLSAYVRHMVDERGFSPSDILVLSPRRKLAYRLRDQLVGESIAAHSFFREEALEEVGAQEGMALLALLANPDDRPALRWWLGRGSKTHRSGEYRRLRDHCVETDQSPRDALERIASGEEKLAGVKGVVGAYVELKERVRGTAELDVADLVDLLFPLDEEGYESINRIAAALLAQSESVPQLFEGVRNYITQPEELEGDFLRIMSLQKAKGLTSPIVVVASSIEGLLPNLDDEWTPEEYDASIKEQRRLFYVAVTRCTNALVVSSFSNMSRKEGFQLGAKLRPRPRGRGNAVASRYVDELGPEKPDAVRGSDWLNSGFIT